MHVIDMHQLTKDPSAAVIVGGKTPSSPARTLTPYELSRYLDYCSEMMSLTSKVAVLFAQSLPDPVVTEAVSDIERIASGHVAEDLAEDHDARRADPRVACTGAGAGAAGPAGVRHPAAGRRKHLTGERRRGSVPACRATPNPVAIRCSSRRR